MSSSQYTTKLGSAIMGPNYIKHTGVKTVQDCMDLCSADSDCAAGTLRHDGICALKKTIPVSLQPRWDDTPNLFKAGFYRQNSNL